MEEEEEVDILGDYDGFFSKNERDIVFSSSMSSGQILSCDYTVHPLWLDNTDTPDFWNDSIETNNQESVPIENSPKSADETEIVPNIIDINPEFIEEEIIHDDDLHFNGITELEWCNEPSQNGKIILEKDIPVSIEEVVMEENNYVIAQPVIRNNTKIIKIKQKHPRSLLKNNILSSSAINDNDNIKFRQTILMKRNNFTNDKLKHINSAVKKTENTNNNLSNKTNVKRKNKTENIITKFKRTIKLKNIKKYKNIFNKTKTKMNKKLVKSKNFIECGEIVKINDHNSDSDIEVDIETDNDTSSKVAKCDNSKSIIINKIDNKINDNYNINNTIVNKGIKDLDKREEKMIKKEDQTQQHTNVFLNNNLKLKQILQSLDVPACETVLNNNEITDLEKFIHSEFFEGRPTKTPERYIKIREHIINKWLEIKPSYVSKTTVRNGLKNCGDVNCISRIHCLLEQIGVINYGCADSCFQYIRPLTKLLSVFLQQSRTRTQTTSTTTTGSNNIPITNIIERRQRIRNNIYNQIIESDSNYTINHMEGVVVPVINVTDKSNKKLITKNKRHHFVKCHKFNEFNLAPFKISINLSTLLSIILHSLSTDYEVIGFLGGNYNYKDININHINKGVKHILLTRCKPCKTSEQSNVMCEMCPVSEFEKATELVDEGYSIFGWYHSHPKFSPTPSYTDINTQINMQMQNSYNNREFVCFIMSCLNLEYKCIYVMPKDLQSTCENGIPYEVDIDVINDVCDNLYDNIKDVFSVINLNTSDRHDLINKFKNIAITTLDEKGLDLSILDILNQFY